MADQNSDIAEPKLLFSKEEWEAATPKLTADMTAYLKQYRTPVFIDRGDHGLGEDDVESLERAIAAIQHQLHPGVRPFRLALNSVTKALSEASLADVKALEPRQVEGLMEAVAYFNDLVRRHNPLASAAA